MASEKDMACLNDVVAFWTVSFQAVWLAAGFCAVLLLTAAASVHSTQPQASTKPKSNLKQSHEQIQSRQT